MHMPKKVIEPSNIPGWGVDANPKNDPTYPIKKRNNGEHAGYSWERPTQQPVTVEILHSNERPHVTSVFGTSTPPAGLSGAIRRYAFKYSESSYGHWLPLMAADRVGVVEGLLRDVVRGRIFMVFTDRGWRADWKHNRASLIGRIALRVGLIAGVTALIVAASNRR
jgi:hypothetical protein